jgi:hypothetical protein
LRRSRILSRTAGLSDCERRHAQDKSGQARCARSDASSRLLHLCSPLRIGVRSNLSCTCTVWIIQVRGEDEPR